MGLKLVGHWALESLSLNNKPSNATFHLSHIKVDQKAKAVAGYFFVANKK